MIAKEGLPLRALVVEDDPSWQQILVEILVDSGLSVDMATNYDEAIGIIRATSHRLAVLDLSLGGIDHLNQDGLKVIEAVSRLDPGCTSIFLTGFATVELAVNVIRELGAYTCLRKETFRRAEFRKILNQALAASPPAVDKSGKEGQPVQLNTATELGAGPEEVKPDNAFIAEDDAGWRSLLTELLGEAGYHVEQCSSYVEALGILRNTDFQLAVVDLSLASSLTTDANQDGYRLLAMTQKMGVPTIIVSGYAEPEVIERAYAEYHLYACLEKQAFDRKKFVSTVDKARLVRGASGQLPTLTGREREVLALLARGMTNKQIATTLVITTNTVKRHVKSLFAKLNVSTRAAASAIATKAGMLEKDMR